MSYKSEAVQAVLPRINSTFFLPALQREFVWTADQICELFDSLMRRYPISADSDEAGHAFQSEAGHLFRSEAGRGSALRRASAGRWDDVFLCWLGQVDGSSIRRLRMLSPASSIR